MPRVPGSIVAGGYDPEGFNMRLSAVVNCVAFASLLNITGAAIAAPNAAPERISGPVVHENLAIYFVHGRTRAAYFGRSARQPSGGHA